MEWPFQPMISSVPWSPTEDKAQISRDCCFTLYPQTRKNILSVSPGNMRSHIIHDSPHPPEIYGMPVMTTSPHNGDKVGNLRLDEVKSGLEVSRHCQGPLHLTFRLVERESLTWCSLPSFKRKIIFNWAQNTYLLIRYHVPTASIYWTFGCLLCSWYGSGCKSKIKQVTQGDKREVWKLKYRWDKTNIKNQRTKNSQYSVMKCGLLWNSLQEPE